MKHPTRKEIDDLYANAAQGAPLHAEDFNRMRKKAQARRTRRELKLKREHNERHKAQSLSCPGEIQKSQERFV